MIQKSLWQTFAERFCANRDQQRSACKNIWGQPGLLQRQIVTECNEKKQKRKSEVKFRGGLEDVDSNKHWRPIWEPISLRAKGEQLNFGRKL